MTTATATIESPKPAFCPCGGMLGLAGCLEVSTFGAHIRPIANKYGTKLAAYSRGSFDPDFAGQSDCDGARDGVGGWQ